MLLMRLSKIEIVLHLSSWVFARISSHDNSIYNSYIKKICIMDRETDTERDRKTETERKRKRERELKREMNECRVKEIRKIEYSLIFIFQVTVRKHLNFWFVIDVWLTVTHEITYDGQISQLNEVKVAWTTKIIGTDQKVYPNKGSII